MSSYSPFFSFFLFFIFFYDRRRLMSRHPTVLHPAVYVAWCACHPAVLLLMWHGVHVSRGLFSVCAAIECMPMSAQEDTPWLIHGAGARQTVSYCLAQLTTTTTTNNNNARRRSRLALTGAHMRQRQTCMWRGC